MTNYTRLDLEATSVPATLPAVQTGPVYHCFQCGAQATALTTWNEMPQLGGYSPLDGWGDHIAYLKLPCACSAEVRRVAKSGVAITPLAFPLRSNYPKYCNFAEAEIAAIRAALAAIALATSQYQGAVRRPPETGDHHATGTPA